MTTGLLKRRKALLMGSLLFFIITVGVYYQVSWKEEEAEILRSVDARLQFAVETIPLFLAPDFHDRAVSSDSIPLKEELFNRERLNALVEFAGLNYAHTVVKHEGKFYFSSLSLTRDEEEERESWYFYPYVDIPAAYQRAFLTGGTTFLEYTDQWGAFRSVSRSKVSSQGHSYLVVADIDTASVQSQLQKARIRPIANVFFILLIMSPLGYVLLKLMTDLKEMNRDLENAKNQLESVVGAQQVKIADMTSHDLSTGLWNREGFLLRMKEMGERKGRTPAVLVFVVRDFKRINEALGIAGGDEVLCAISKRLKESLLPCEELARLGGVEFALASNEIEDKGAGHRVAERLLSVLAVPFIIAEREFYLSGNVGIVPSSQEKTYEESLSSATIAAIEAKRTERDRILFYDERLQNRSIQAIELENHLRNAIQERAFTIYFQPIVDIQSGKISGVEALARWFMPDGRSVSPADFVPLAESTGLIHPLSEILFTLSGEGFLRLQQDTPDLFLSLNISPVLFGEDSVEKLLHQFFENTGIAPKSVILEITETALIADMENCRIILERLVKRGYSIAIDDFGVGNSSISYLQKFPIKKLKIDQSFVRNIGVPNADWTLIRAILSMTRVLQIEVVAEGVETPRQEEFLRKLKCAQGQGYFYYYPMDVESCLLALRDSEKES